MVGSVALLAACEHVRGFDLPSWSWGRGGGATVERRAIPPSGVHVVQRGDTLSGIARSYGIDMAALAQTNDLGDVNRLEPGQVLRLAAPAEPSPRRSAALEPEAEPPREPLRVVIRPPAPEPATPVPGDATLP